MNETLIGSWRGLKGGAWSSGGTDFGASFRGYYNPLEDHDSIGFRIAGVPEPSTLVLLTTAALALLLFARRRR